jgi:hypothetical protein
MKKINFLLALFMLISVNFNLTFAANNYKLYPFSDADADASLLVNAGVYTDATTAQKSIFHYDAASPWKFGNSETSTQKFFIYTATNATWQNSAQWQTTDGNFPLVFDGHTYANNLSKTPAIFFVAPDAAIYKVSATFNYASGNSATVGSTLFQFKANGGSSVVDMNFGKSFTSSNRTVASDFYVNLHAGDTITFNQVYTTIGDPYCQWTQLKVLGNNIGASFTSTEANASGFYYDNYVVATDFSFLNAKITTSETLIGAAVSGTTIGKYPATAITTFQSAIDAAKSFVSTQPSATQLAINAQLATLSTAYSTFESAKITSVIVTDDAADQYRLVSGLYLIRLKGTNLYLTAPTAKGTAAGNRTTYQTLRDANLQNCQKWSIQYNQNSGFTNPARYTFVSGIDGTTNWTEANATVVGHLDEGGFLRDKNTADTQIGAEGTYHNFTVYYDGTAYGLNNVGFNRPLNISATVSGQTVTMSYGTASPIQFLYEFILAPNVTTAVNQAEINTTKIISIENGIRVIGGNGTAISIYNLAGMTVKNCIVKSDEIISLSKGAYIVKSNNSIQKVVVR